MMVKFITAADDNAGTVLPWAWCTQHSASGIIAGLLDKFTFKSQFSSAFKHAEILILQTWQVLKNQDK